ncbi:MAG: hypothetical protein K6U07_05530 [Firmicutes bacterium]|jgi:uncharacterized membrane protein|nr:hypothetical protein [Bacillota bacterium]
MDQTARGTDAPGRVLGLAVFVLGVVLLLFVFYVAYTELTGNSLSQVARPPQGGPDMGLALALVLKAIFLFLLGYLASGIAGRGIGLYQASRGEPAE